MEYMPMLKLHTNISLCDILSLVLSLTRVFSSPLGLKFLGTASYMTLIF